MVEVENVTSLTDEAGHTLRLVFRKLKEHGRELKAQLESLQYDNSPVVDLRDTKLSYEYSVSKDLFIKELEQEVKVREDFKVEAHYHQKKGKTLIKVKGPGQHRSTLELPGLVIVGLVTNNSNVGYFYSL